MSSKVYFSDKNRGILRYGIRALSESYRFVYPIGAEKTLRRFLLTPQKPRLKDIPESFTSQSKTTEYGELVSYTVGEGPVILFVHGWSGAGSQFFGLMQRVADTGFTAITFDHFKHGRSSGLENCYPLFYKTIKIVIEQLGDKPLAGVVSHSMGSGVCVDYFKGTSYPQYLIAPVLNFFDELQSRIDSAGISKAFFKKVVKSIESDYGMAIEGKNGRDELKDVLAPVTIIHSRTDKFAPFIYSQEASENQDNIELIPLDDVGHMKIVSAPETIEGVLKFASSLS